MEQQKVVVFLRERKQGAGHNDKCLADLSWRAGGAMVGALLVIFGAMGIAGAIFAKDFYVGDGLGEFKAMQRMPTWLGRLVCGIAGVGLVAIGFKMLIEGK